LPYVVHVDIYDPEFTERRRRFRVADPAGFSATVLLDGEPLEGVHVTFHCEQLNMVGEAFTGPDGIARVVIHVPWEGGEEPGHYTYYAVAHVPPDVKSGVLGIDVVEWHPMPGEDVAELRVETWVSPLYWVLKPPEGVAEFVRDRVSGIVPVIAPELELRAVRWNEATGALSLYFVPRSPIAIVTLLAALSAFIWKIAPIVVFVGAVALGWKAFDWLTTSEKARVEESRERQIEAIMESELTEEQKAEMVRSLEERWGEEEAWVGMMRTIVTMVPIVIGGLLLIEIVRAMRR